MDTECSSANSNEASPDLAPVVRELLASEGLRLSERNRRFLSFVAGEAVAGRGERIKAYTIGVDVFGRSPDFDPCADPIVRIEATRIRSALAAYYKGPGADDPVRLILRPGSYIPVVEMAEASLSSRIGDNGRPRGASASTCARADRATTSVVVTHQRGQRERCACARGDMYLQAVVKAVSGHGFRVFLTPLPERRAIAPAIKELLSQAKAVFALDVAVHGTAEGCRYSWSLRDLRTGEVKLADAIDGTDEAVPAGARIDAMADVVAQSVADAFP